MRITDENLKELLLFADSASFEAFHAGKEHACVKVSALKTKIHSLLSEENKSKSVGEKLMEKFPFGYLSGNGINTGDSSIYIGEPVGYSGLSTSDNLDNANKNIVMGDEVGKTLDSAEREHVFYVDKKEGKEEENAEHNIDIAYSKPISSAKDVAIAIDTCVQDVIAGLLIKLNRQDVLVNIDLTQTIEKVVSEYTKKSCELTLQEKGHIIYPKEFIDALHGMSDSTYTDRMFKKWQEGKL